MPQAVRTKPLAPPKPVRLLAQQLVPGALCLLLFLLIVYRAVTQSLTHDEAQAWWLYVAGPRRNVFHWADAGNHFLFSLLARASVALFGPAEFAMRLPAVAGAALYLMVVRRLASWAFPSVAGAVLCVVLLGANPLVLDLLVAARGYAIALASLLGAAFLLMRYWSGENRPWLLVGASAGLSAGVMANLTLLVPAAVVAVGVLFAVPRRHWLAFFLPAAILAALFAGLFTPVRQMGRGQLYFGTPNLGESLESLGRASVAHNEGVFSVNRFSGVQFHAARLLAWCLWPAACLAALLVPRGNGRAALAGRWCAVVVLASWAVLIAAHYVAGLLYPLERTGIYFLPLCGLVVVALAEVLPRCIRPVPLAVAVFLACSYAVQLNWTHFAAWRYDADTRDLIASYLVGDTSRKLGVTWRFAPAARFYLSRAKAPAPEVVGSDRPPSGLGAILLGEDEVALVRDWGFKIERKGALSGTVLARPGH